jgi:hypothetical protein
MQEICKHKKSLAEAKEQTTFLYAVRRKDTGEFFKNVKSGWLKSWPKDDPRRSNWTPELSQATLYPLRGAKPIVGQLMSPPVGMPETEYEIVRLKVAIDGIEPAKES